MISISKKAKIIATILHLAIVGIIISFNISERHTLLEMGNALVTEVRNEYLKPVEVEIHMQLLKANETKLALVIVTAIIVQFVIIAIKQVGPRVASH